MRSKAATLVVVLVMAAALAGCSSGSTEPETSNPGSTQPPTTTTISTVPTTTVAPTTTITTTSTVATTTTTTPVTTTSEGPSVPLSNGDFETGDLTGWSTETREDGEWVVYEYGTIPPKPSITDQEFPFEVFDPPQGRYAAVTDMDNAGVRLLYRDIEVNGPYLLHATVFYVNAWGGFRDPSHLRLTTEANQPAQNQQYRLDLLDPSAPVFSLEPDDILATVFRTKPGDPLSLEPTALTFDLSPWEGQTIRLRAAEVDSQAPIRAGIDDVRLELGG